MAAPFLHGIEVIEDNSGPRTIRTVDTAIIGVVGTAPDAELATAATLQTGIVASNNALTFTAKSAGKSGNTISVYFRNPKTNNAPFSVSVADRVIVINLATGATGTVTTTAANIIAGIAAAAAAAALVDVANTGASTGANPVAGMNTYQALSGGQEEALPLNVPVVVTREVAARIGTVGTIPTSLADIFEVGEPLVVAIRVAAGVDETATMTNVVGSTGVGAKAGVWALLDAQSIVHYKPKILIAPGFTHQRPSGAKNPVVADLVTIAERLKAIIVKDGPATDDTDAATDRGDWGSRRVYIVDPKIKVFFAGENVTRPASARVAAVIAMTDLDVGFWTSPSNREIPGVLGTSRPIDFSLGDPSCRANQLNAKEIATIVRHQGYRLWGNRTTSADPKFAFLQVVRTADAIEESIQSSLFWAIDMGLSKVFFEAVSQSVKNYFAELQRRGAIIGGNFWFTAEENPPSQLSSGQAVFRYDFCPVYPAERITIYSSINTEYLTKVVS